MKTFIIHYVGGTEPVQAFGEFEAKAIFRRINPCKAVIKVVTYAVHAR